MKLSQLRPGECGTVTEIASGPLTQRLRDLGLTDGTAITCVFTSPLGDPCAYSFRGSVIAMRKKDASAVGVRHHGT